MRESAVASASILTCLFFKDSPAEQEVTRGSTYLQSFIALPELSFAMAERLWLSFCFTGYEFADISECDWVKTPDHAPLGWIGKHVSAALELRSFKAKAHNPKLHKAMGRHLHAPFQADIQGVNP